MVLEAVCNRTWDGWLCWDDTKAGVVSEQHCPDYFQDFDPSGEVLNSKTCWVQAAHVPRVLQSLFDPFWL